MEKTVSGICREINLENSNFADKNEVIYSYKSEKYTIYKQSLITYTRICSLVLYQDIMTSVY